ncbi:DoxX family protein [Tunicatimonas pelagia]|uniref:DoxX family protein n=1 Tax=Tunicatimonas pelagia TaxID=931531 RepID=UPI0026656484|nr:DoxX family protein [Tunicatimonas pelagia]WKN42055.1 DoxX family protein [Tunicatimonas pelagia]
MKAVKITYYVTLSLFTLLMIFSAFNYFFNYEDVKGAFQSLEFPTYVIYPLAIAKLLGLVAIWTKQSIVLKEWAYAGFFFNIALAASAHINAGDGQAAGAFVALALLATVYFTEKKVIPEKSLATA